MKTRNGKIARLPLAIREQLNVRLADGEPGNRLVEWLNSNPDVIKVIVEHFEGRPITENNLSEWRAGGYEEWVTLHDFLDETRVLSENAGEIVDTGISSDHLHIILLAHHAHLLQNLGIMPEDEYKTRLNTVRKLTTSIMNLRRDELQKARLELQRERLELLREKESLKSTPSEALGIGAGEGAGGCLGKGGGPGKSRVAKAISSTSTNARPTPLETKMASHPEIRPSAESPDDRISAPSLSTPSLEAGLTVHPDLVGFTRTSLTFPPIYLVTPSPQAGFSPNSQIRTFNLRPREIGRIQSHRAGFQHCGPVVQDSQPATVRMMRHKKRPMNSPREVERNPWLSGLRSPLGLARIGRIQSYRPLPPRQNSPHEPFPNPPSPATARSHGTFPQFPTLAPEVASLHPLRGMEWPTKLKDLRYKKERLH